MFFQMVVVVVVVRNGGCGGGGCGGGGGGSLSLFQGYSKWRYHQQIDTWLPMLGSLLQQKASAKKTMKCYGLSRVSVWGAP